MHGLGLIAGAHLLRWVVVLVALGPLARTISRRRGGDPRSQWITAVRLRFAVVGLLLGGIWAWRSEAPLWEHALRLVVVMLVVAPLLRWARTRASNEDSRSYGPTFSARYWLSAKLALIGAGTALQSVLQQVISPTYASLIVGGLLFGFVALGGPAVMTWAVNRRRTDASFEAREHSLV